MIGIDLKLLAGCTAAGCCALCSYCAYQNREKIPHPSEVDFIGKIYLYLGCHDHEKFDMLVEIQQLQAQTSKKCFIEVISGRFEANTVPVKGPDGIFDIQERLSIHVRQCDQVIEIRAIQKGIISNEVLGSIVLNVNDELLSQGMPKRKWYSLEKEGMHTVRLQISFHKLNIDNVNLGPLNLSPLVQQALLQAQYTAESKGQKMEVDVEDMDELDQIRFFSSVLEGPLQKMKLLGNSWQDLYFKACERDDGKWEWRFWDSKVLYQNGESPKGKMNFLGISLVIPDNNDRTSFYVRYHDLEGVHDMIFRRVDRDRNIWSEGLYEFIERLRAYIEINDDNRVIGFIKRNKHLKENAKSQSNSSTLTTKNNSSTENLYKDSKERRLPSPRENLAKKKDLEEKKISLGKSDINQTE